eukprot:TRINITY_DN9337_c0_g1_i4.p2 TRINITY_DN9337_c0_g1~~TRINITY_DN9337_c0_g1_i4.p2  ORF type:complete len:128 (+),score=2.29 TRINITY_DN9337_c0_g1_i4:1058-1441(+)
MLSGTRVSFSKLAPWLQQSLELTVLLPNKRCCRADRALSSSSNVGPLRNDVAVLAEIYNRIHAEESCDRTCWFSFYNREHVTGGSNAHQLVSRRMFDSLQRLNHRRQLLLLRVLASDCLSIAFWDLN